MTQNLEKIVNDSYELAEVIMVLTQAGYKQIANALIVDYSINGIFFGFYKCKVLITAERLQWFASESAYQVIQEELAMYVA